MNPTKAAAILSLIVAIGAAGYLVDQATAVRAKYKKDIMDYAVCRSGRDAATANWEYVQSQVDLLNAQGKSREAIEFEQKHAGEKPEFFGQCSDYLDFEPPTYTWPAGISVAGLIASLALFGAAKPKGGSV